MKTLIQYDKLIARRSITVYRMYETNNGDTSAYKTYGNGKRIQYVMTETTGANHTMQNDIHTRWLEWIGDRDKSTGK